MESEHSISNWYGMLETMHRPRLMLSRTHYFAATIAAAAANEDHRRPDECMYRSDYSPPTAWLDDIQKSGGNEMTSLHDTRLWPTAETALLLLLAPWLIIGDSGRPQHIFFLVVASILPRGKYLAGK